MSQTNSPDARAQEVLTMIIDTLHTNSDRLHGHKVVLFGSRARGGAKPRSDFDLGVVGDSPLSLEDFFALEDLLDELPTLYCIDWVDFSRAGDAFRARALQAVKVLYE